MPNRVFSLQSTRVAVGIHEFNFDGGGGAIWQSCALALPNHSVILLAPVQAGLELVNDHLRNSQPSVAGQGRR